MNNELLIKVLELEKAFKSEDVKAVEQVAKEINALTVSDKDIEFLEDTLKNSTKPKMFIDAALNNILFLKSTEVIDLILEIRDGALDKDKIEEILKMDLTYFEPADAHIICRAVCTAVIGLDDSDLLERAIEKLQSIQ